MKKYRAMGWRYTYVGAAASDASGNLTFWQNNGFYGSGKSAASFARLQVGFSTQNRDPGNPGNKRVDVPTIDLSAWIRHHILARSVPVADVVRRRSALRPTTGDQPTIFVTRAGDALGPIYRARCLGEDGVPAGAVAAAPFTVITRGTVRG